MADVEKKLKVDKNFKLGFDHQLKGDIHKAIYYYRKSLEITPSPEAHTFLAWAYSFFGWCLNLFISLFNLFSIGNVGVFTTAKVIK